MLTWGSTPLFPHRTDSGLSVPLWISWGCISPFSPSGWEEVWAKSKLVGTSLPPHVNSPWGTCTLEWADQRSYDPVWQKNQRSTQELGSGKLESLLQWWACRGLVQQATCSATVITRISGFLPCILCASDSSSRYQTWVSASLLWPPYPTTRTGILSLSPKSTVHLIFWW